MDLNKDAKLTFDEFKEGSKLDPTIVQVCRVTNGSLSASAHVMSCRLQGFRFL